MSLKDLDAERNENPVLPRLLTNRPLSEIERNSTDRQSMKTIPARFTLPFTSGADPVSVGRYPAILVKTHHPMFYDSFSTRS
jgi:hypothetical protein